MQLPDALKVCASMLFVARLFLALAPSTEAQSPPYTFHWTDRRPIGMEVIGSTSWKCTNNPRGWFGVTTNDYSSDPVGMSNFAATMMKRVTNEIRILTNMNAQGVIFWDIEGEQTALTYVGDPRVIPFFDPEMDAVADEMFAAYRVAGLRVGVTLRPHSFCYGTNLPSTGTNGNTFFLTSAPVGQWSYYYTNGWLQENYTYAMDKANTTSNSYWDLTNKIAYAYNRWGCTMFYIDSYENLDTWGPVSTGIMSAIAAKYPNVLLSPECAFQGWWATNMYAMCAPFIMPQYQTNCLPPSDALAIYPKAIGLLNINGYTNSALITASIAAGNIVLVNSWFGNPQITMAAQGWSAVGLTPPANLHVVTNAP